MRYQSPLNDFAFLLDEFLPVQLAEETAGAWNSNQSVVEAAGRFAEDILAPLNRSGDEQGCRFDSGRVSTPAGFRQAYAQFRDDGWVDLREDGQQGAVSTALAFCIDEVVAAANIAFSNYVGPTRRVVQALSLQTDAGVRREYLQQLAGGAWGGTLCLTEPHCGTDLGLISTRAEALARNGEYALTGTKIFVTSGEHDLTENIVHLVVARIAGAPAGVKGLSLFLVPKLCRDHDGAPLQPNAVQCAGVEHKMGLRASATCTLQFERARGILIGAAGEGLRGIFPVMERERLSIALQSVGVAGRAYQGAVAYARERLQGRAVTGAQFPQQAADPLIVHGDIRRMLLTMKAYTEGSRALLLWIGAEIDRARREQDPERRRAALDFVQLMTPMAKAFATDVAVETANLGLQVMGGHGYIRESGMEQLLRDVRVTPLYAGANGIQALDLVARKLPARGGAMLELFTASVERVMNAWRSQSDAQHLTAPVFAGLEQLKDATRYLQEHGGRSPHLAGTLGTTYLHLFGHVALSFLWAHAALVAERNLRSGAGGRSRSFYEAKVATAGFYFAHLLPRTDGLLRSILAGADAILQLDPDAY